MTELIRLNEHNIRRSKRYYGGASCGKIGVIYNGENYLLKFPGSLKETQIKNIDTSYSNSSTSEYIGSQIYSLLCIDVHETFLGLYDNKVVVACKDFLADNERLWDFAVLKTSMPIYDAEGDVLTGGSTNLTETLSVIENHPDLENIKDELRNRFWEMFVVDALIGNPDRNNGNWGIISDGSHFRLSPVFDNGSSFHFRKSDGQLKEILKSKSEMQIQAYKGRVCIFEEDGKRINPYKFISSLQNEDCNKAVKRIVPRINLDKIFQIIDETPDLSEIRKTFCKDTVKIRTEDVFLPAYEKLQLMEKQQGSTFSNFLKSKKKSSLQVFKESADKESEPEI